MKKQNALRSGIFIGLLLLGFSSTCFGKWARLETPQSEVLGQKLVGNNLSDNSVPQSAIISKEGANELTEYVKKDIAFKFGGLGIFEDHKLTDVTIKGVFVDYIDYDYLKSHSELQNNWRVYKGLRANEVTLTFDNNGKIGLTPEIIFNALAPKIKTFLKVEDLNFNYTNVNKPTVKITNPKVYFRVQVAKLNLVESNTVAPFYSSNTSNFTLTFPNNKERTRQVNLDDGVRPRFQIALEKDSSNDLMVRIYMPDDFAKANNLTNPITVPKTNIGDNIFEYRMQDKTIGIISKDNRDYFIKIGMEGIQKNENEVEFKHWISPDFKTKIRFPYAKFQFKNIDTIN